MEWTGVVVVEKVCGKSTVTRCFSEYPLKLIIPTKVAGSSKADAVWIYSLSYGGGIVSGDRVGCSLTVGDDCTAVLTTQASTKVYKSLDSKCSEQILEVRVGRNALLVVIPDPVTCFASARYIQKQVFKVTTGSSLLLVDWFTSGRRENGEKWNFELYKSTNNIFFEDDRPLFLDSILLEGGSTISIAESMHNYQVIAMVILLGPQLQNARTQVQEQVKDIMTRHYRHPIRPRHYLKSKSENQNYPMPPAIIASCSTFGPEELGLVVRIAALTTESVYDFLRVNLASMEPLIGVSPYR